MTGISSPHNSYSGSNDLNRIPCRKAQIQQSRREEELQSQIKLRQSTLILPYVEELRRKSPPEGMHRDAVHRFVRGDQSVPTERNRNQLRSRLERPCMDRQQDRSHVGESKSIAIIFDYCPDKATTNLLHRRLKATTSFTFIVLWHHCQDTQPLTRQELNTCKRIALSSDWDPQNVRFPKSLAYVEEEIPRTSVR
jgi:hypothetical protein